MSEPDKPNEDQGRSEPDKPQRRSGKVGGRQTQRSSKTVERNIFENYVLLEHRSGSAVYGEVRFVAREGTGERAKEGNIAAAPFLAQFLNDRSRSSSEVGFP